MIRLLLASYSSEERSKLAKLLAEVQADIEKERGCERFGKQYCYDCPNRHICTDLLNASVFAEDYVDPVK